MLSRIALVIGLALGVLVAGPEVAATAAGPALSWGPTQRPDPYRGRVTAVDCVDAGWCMAVDDSGQAVRYASGHWHAPVRVEPSQPLYGFAEISCATRSLCFALDRNSRVARWNGTAWSNPVALGRFGDLRAISCPSATSCFAIGDRIARWNGTRWSVITGLVKGTDEESDLSCVGPHFCVALVQRRARTDVYQYRDGLWTRTARFGFGAGASVSCTSRRFCLAIGSYDHVEFWNGHRWRRAAAPSMRGSAVKVSCTSRWHCLLLGEPLSGRADSVEWDGQGWSRHPRTVGIVSSTFGLSCAGRTLTCLAIDQMGGASWFREHRWGRRTMHDSPWGELTNAACGATRCLIIDRPGGFVESEGSGWSRPRRAFVHGDLSGHSSFALSCTGDSFCLAGTVAGNTRRWNGRSWTTVATSPLKDGSELSCVDPHWCAEIVPSTGAMAVFDGTRWHARPSLGFNPPVWTLSCGARGSCIAASNGVVRVFAHGRWSARYRLPGTTTNSTADVSCTSATFCMVLADDGTTWRWDGRSWHAVPISAFPQSISCTSSTFCAELDYEGVQLWDGSSWTASTTLQPSESSSYSLIACASPKLCVIGNRSNEVRIGQAA